MTEYTNTMTQLLEHMNKIYGNESQDNCHGDDTRQQDGFVSSDQFEGNSWASKNVGVLNEQSVAYLQQRFEQQQQSSDGSYDPNVDSVIVLNLTEQMDDEQATFAHPTENSSWLMGSDIDSLFDNRYVNDSTSSNEVNSSKRKREDQQFLGGDEFVDSNLIDLDEFISEKRVKLDQVNMIQQQTMSYCDEQLADAFNGYDSQLICTVLDLYQQMQRQQIGGLMDPNQPLPMPTVKDLQEFAEFLQNHDIATLQPPLEQNESQSTRESPKKNSSLETPAANDPNGQYKYLVCNGTIKRKNKRQEPEDKWTMKWKLCN